MLHRLDKRLGEPQESVGRFSRLDNAKALISANCRNSARGTIYSPTGLNYRYILKVGQSPGWEGWTKPVRASFTPAMLGGA